MAIRSALLFASLATALSSQGVVAPFEIGQVNPLAGLGAVTLGVSEVSHVHMVHLPPDPPNVFYCSVTIWNPPATWGGAGTHDVVCGSYDVLTDTFVPNNETAALNTTDFESHLMVQDSGLLAVFERHIPSTGTREVWLVSRPMFGQPWQQVGQVAMPASSGSYTPALAGYQGQAFLVYSDGSGISMVQIDPTNAAVLGAPVVVENAPSGSLNTSRPVPITDPTGEMLGLCHTASLGFHDSDHYLSFDLDPSTPAMLIAGAPAQTMAAGFVGGRFFNIQRIASNPHVYALDTCWFTGGRASVGGMMRVRMFAPPNSGTHSYQSLIASSAAFTIAGQPFPPAQGLLGIDAATAWATNLIPHDNLNGEARLSFPVPNVPALSGVRLPVQSVTWETMSGAVFLGNTAALIVE